MTGLRIVTYRVGDSQRVGVVQGEVLFDAAALTHHPSDAAIGPFMRRWDAALGAISSALATGAHDGVPVAKATLGAPIRQGAAIYGAGANYYGHSLEMASIAGRPAPVDPKQSGQQPWHFLKAPSTVVGHGAIVERPALAPESLDWEVELAVIIGRRAKNVPVSRAQEHVAAYTVGNDLSARGMLWREGVQPASPFRADWVLHKNFDGSTPLGPCLVPAGEIVDPQNLALGLSVNGIEMQADRTSDMIFSVAEQIAHLSRSVTLTPGDVILTGTPGGNAAFHGRFLQPGDQVDAWVEGIGTLRTEIV